jgi:hypothetical protein
MPTLAFYWNQHIVDAGIIVIPLLGIAIGLAEMNQLSFEKRLRISRAGAIALAIACAAVTVLALVLFSRTAARDRLLFLSAPGWIACGAMTIRLCKRSGGVTFYDVLLGAILGTAACWLLGFLVAFASFVFV